LQQAFRLAHANRLAEAAAACAAAARADPNSIEAWINLGNLSRRLGRDEEAIHALTHAIQLDPRFVESRRSLASLLRQLGRCNEAMVEFSAAATVAPTDQRIQSELLYTYLFAHADDPHAVFDQHVRWAQQHATPVLNRFRFDGRDRDTNRRLRVGYVSP